MLLRRVLWLKRDVFSSGERGLKGVAHAVVGRGGLEADLQHALGVGFGQGVGERPLARLRCFSGDQGSRGPQRVQGHLQGVVRIGLNVDLNGLTGHESPVEGASEHKAVHILAV